MNSCPREHPGETTAILPGDRTPVAVQNGSGGRIAGVRIPGRMAIRSMWFAAILAVMVGSLLPSDSLAMQTIDRLPLSDKIEHAGIYALIAFLPSIRERRGVVVASAAGAVALGIGLEIAQLLTGWRDFEVADMVADTVGVCIGLALGLAVRTLLRSSIVQK